MISLNIPTKWSEIKEIIKNRTNKKYKHNKDLFNQLAEEICEELESGYWSRDLSEYMRKEFTNYPYGKIYTVIRKYKSQVK